MDERSPWQTSHLSLSLFSLVVLSFIASAASSSSRLQCCLPFFCPCLRHRRHRRSCASSSLRYFCKAEHYVGAIKLSFWGSVLAEYRLRRVSEGLGGRFLVASRGRASGEEGKLREMEMEGFMFLVFLKEREHQGSMLVDEYVGCIRVMGAMEGAEIGCFFGCNIMYDGKILLAHWSNFCGMSQRYKVV